MAGTQRPERGGTPARRRYTVPMVIAATAVLAVSMIRGSGDSSGPPQPASVDAPVDTPAGTSADPGEVPAAPGVLTADGTVSPLLPAPPSSVAGLTPLPFSAPTEVRIPALGVDAPMTTVGAEPDGGIGAPPPEYANLAAWFTGAPSPGERGTAVIDGHVDNMQGPAVFYGLGALHKGNHVEVVRADGVTAVFTIYGVEVFAKDDFPGDRVYGPSEGPELRVITCGGGFSKKTGYDSNVVVFARLSAVH